MMLVKGRSGVQEREVSEQSSPNNETHQHKTRKILINKKKSQALTLTVKAFFFSLFYYAFGDVTWRHEVNSTIFLKPVHSAVIKV